jgi:hypothetical protein
MVSFLTFGDFPRQTETETEEAGFEVARENLKKKLFFLALMIC